jgi:hypothetical protein
MGSFMPSLHISKVAVGCGSVDALRQRQLARLRDGHVPVTTRFRPKRAVELVGGSQKLLENDTVALLFLFDKHYPIME